MRRLYGTYGQLSYGITLDEMKTFRLALENWERKIIDDGDYKECPLMEQELATTRRLIGEVEAEEKRLERVAAMGGRA